MLPNIRIIIYYNFEGGIIKGQLKVTKGNQITKERTTEMAVVMRMKMDGKNIGIGIYMIIFGFQRLRNKPIKTKKNRSRSKNENKK